MGRKHLFAGLVLGVALTSALPSQAALNTWVNIRSGGFGSVAIVAAPDPAAPPLVFGGTSLAATGVVRSSDDGATWTTVLPHVARSIAGDPNTPGVVYAATMAGLFKSADYGTTWGLLTSNVKAWIAVNTGNPLVLYGDNLRSADGGATWTAMTGLPAFSGTGSSSPHLQVSKSDPLRLIALSGFRGAYLSTDGGLTWASMLAYGYTPRLARSDIYGLTLDPVDANRYYIGYCNSVQWFNGAYSGTASASGDQFNLVVDPGAHANVFVIGQWGTAYRSTNFGLSYSSYRSFPGGDTIPGRVIMDERGRIYAADNTGLWMIQTRSEACTGKDQDGDGYYAAEGCGTPVDCSDTDATVNPGRIENCVDARDNNCNGQIDFADAYCLANCSDLDGDGYMPVCGGGLDCNNNNAAVFPGALEVCDLVDNDCDKLRDEDFDLDGDSFTTCGGDCDDGSYDIRPYAEEKKMDGVDQDCDGYDLTIRVVKTVHFASKQTLTVEALSRLEAEAGLTLYVSNGAYVPMEWDAKRKLWAVTIGGVAEKPYYVLVTGIEGSESALVQ